MLVRDVMTKDPATIRRGRDMRAAITMLGRGRFRHLPVVDGDGALVGVVSQTDVLAAMPSMFDPSFTLEQRDAFLGFVSIDKLIRSDVVTVAPEASIVEAARLMRDRRINCLPVVSRERLVGIVTSYDLLAALEVVRR